MPALITHFIFGEETLNRVCPQLAANDVEDCAFYLGNQGPDPLYFGVTTPRGADVRALASQMHGSHMARAFEVLRAGVDRLPEADRRVGRAFAAGMLGHYALDRTAHPYVYALENELCAASPELTDAHHEVHALIEAEIDCGTLEYHRGQRCDSFAPVDALEKDPQVVRAAGALVSDVGHAVFGLGVRPGDYARALDDMRLCYRLIEPYGSAASRRVGALERTMRRHSQLEALAHRTDLGMENNPSMNFEKRRWEDPSDGRPSQESFAEVFERALGYYRELLGAWLAGDPMGPVVAGVDYNGRPAK
jgi:hypothetical protein